MRESPIPLLVFFLMIGILPSLAHGQDEPEARTEAEAQQTELVRINKLTARGPHRKNPLAAGRMLVLNAQSKKVKRLKERRIPKAERRSRRSTFTSLRYQEPAQRSSREKKSQKSSGAG